MSSGWSLTCTLTWPGVMNTTSFCTFVFQERLSYQPPPVSISPRYYSSFHLWILSLPSQTCSHIYREILCCSRNLAEFTCQTLTSCQQRRSARPCVGRSGPIWLMEPSHINVAIDFYMLLIKSYTFFFFKYHGQYLLFWLNLYKENVAEFERFYGKSE